MTIKSLYDKRLLGLIATASLTFEPTVKAAVRPEAYSPSQDSHYASFSVGRVFVSFAGDYFHGSGTSNGRHVLTCAHVLYHPNVGFADSVVFERGRNGDNIAETSTPAGWIILGGYQQRADKDFSNGFDDVASPSTFRRDIGALIFDPLVDLPDKGTAVHLGDSTWLNIMGRGSRRGATAYGYPGEGGFDGQTLTVSVLTKPFLDLGGGLFTSADYTIYRGMSGGPVIANVFYPNSPRKDVFDNGFLKQAGDLSGSIVAVNVSNGGDVRAVTKEVRELVYRAEIQLLKPAAYLFSDCDVAAESGILSVVDLHNYTYLTEATAKMLPYSSVAIYPFLDFGGRGGSGFERSRIAGNLALQLYDPTAHFRKGFSRNGQPVQNWYLRSLSGDFSQALVTWRCLGFDQKVATQATRRFETIQSQWNWLGGYEF